jgi:hypothetical protein
VQQSSLCFLADLAYNIGMFLDCMVCFLVLPNEFNKLGTVLQEEIFASSFAAAAYLKSINFPSDKKVQAFLSLDTLYEQLNFSVPS